MYAKRTETDWQALAEIVQGTGVPLIFQGDRGGKHGEANLEERSRGPEARANALYWRLRNLLEPLPPERSRWRGVERSQRLEHYIQARRKRPRNKAVVPDVGSVGDWPEAGVPTEPADAMDLKHYQTNELAGKPDTAAIAQNTAELDAGASRGYLTDNRTGRTIDVPEPWIERARRVKRVGEAWLDAYAQAIDDGDVWLIAESATFADVDAWHPRAIVFLVTALRKNLGAKLIDYFWTAEMQERGAPHYNLLMIVAPRTFVPMFDKTGWWTYGSTHHFGRLRTARAARYLVGYSTKSAQKGGPGGPAFPKGLRAYGMRLSKTVGPFMRTLVKLALLPAWLRLQVMARSLTLGWTPRKSKATDPDGHRFGVWWFDGKAYQSPWSWSGSLVTI